MPQIGSPTDSRPNPFSNIKMRDGENADRLNRIAGNKEISNGIQYVDATTHNKMGKDEFLKLLTVQLANQDPMQPVDQKKFAADLAQFSQLEQMANMNTKLEGLQANRNAESKFYGASFLGKVVRTKGTTIEHDGQGNTADVSFSLPRSASRVMIRIMDEKGQNIANIDRMNMNKGSHVLEWDGKKLDGQSANKGSYTFKIFAWDESNDLFHGETKSSGLVNSVRFDNGKTLLKLDNGKEIFLHDVENFDNPLDNKKNTPIAGVLNGHR